MSKKRKEPSMIFWTLVIMFLLNGLISLVKNKLND